MAVSHGLHRRTANAEAAAKANEISVLEKPTRKAPPVSPAVAPAYAQNGHWSDGNRTRANVMDNYVEASVGINQFW